jgi:formate dehydrogenase major subunit
MTLGGGAMTNSIPEIGAESDCIFIIGSNTAECHPLIARQVIRARERGARLIVADPRRTEMANKADVWLQVPPGYNIPLLNGMINIIIEEKLHDGDFIASCTEGFEEMKQAAAEWTPKRVNEVTGIPAEDLRKAARLYAGGKAAVILYCMGVTQFSFGTGTVVSLSNLAAITGNLGRPGTGVDPLRGQNNVQGACDMGCLPNVFPGYLSVTTAENRARFSKEWGVELPSTVGLKVSEVPEAILEGKIRALYIFGENPVMSDPDCDHFRKSLEQLDFLIVQDIFLSETARLADVVFPAACWGEKDGTFTSTERRVQLVRKAVAPPGEAREDWWVFKELAGKMGYRGLDYLHPREIWEEVRRVVPEKFGGICYRRLNEQRGIHWPCPSEDHPGTPILYSGGKFSTPSGKAQLRPVIFDPVQVPEEKTKAFPGALTGSIKELPDEDYPFTLTTGRRVYHYHTGTMTRRAEVLNTVGAEQLIEVNPVDAARMGIKDGDFVRIATRRGSITAKAWVTGRVPEKTLFTSFHFWEANVNELTNTVRDPVAGIPEYKVCAARLERVTPAEAASSYKEKMEKYRLDLVQKTKEELERKGGEQR